MIRASTILICLMIASAAQAGAIPLPTGDKEKPCTSSAMSCRSLPRWAVMRAACHGSFQGKGGFTLSLFGYDQTLDYLALTRDGMGRRVSRSDPDRSLVLLKATAQVPHGGGNGFDKTIWQHAVFREWIAQGCPRDAGSVPLPAWKLLPRSMSFGGPAEHFPFRHRHLPR